MNRIAPRARPRRGRVVDPGFMEFCRRQGCILKDRHDCRGVITFHHVRSYGSPRDDTRGFGLCAAGHLHALGEHSIERLGKRRFEEHWCIDIESEIARLRERYQVHMVKVRPADSEVQ